MANKKETSIGIKLVTDLRQYQQGLNQAQKQNKKFVSGSKRTFGGFKKIASSAAAALGPLLAVTSFVAAGRAAFNYAKEISNVGKKIEDLTGLAGAANHQMTGGVQALAETYNAELDESIEASNVLMKTFGKTADETFDYLNTGLSGAANSNGEFLKQVREYGVHFKEAGASAEDMYQVIKNANEQGVWDDKAADAIKEGSIRLREMTDVTKEAINGIGLSADTIQQQISNGTLSMFDAMKMVSGQLQTLPDQAPEVGAALADIFGGPGEDGIQFIRTLSDIDSEMENISEGATEAQTAQMQWAEELQEFHTLGAQVFGGTGKMMTRLKTIGLSALNDMMKGAVGLINYFIDLYNESAVFRGVIQGVGLAVKTVFAGMKANFKSLLEIFKTSGKVLKAVFTGDWKSIGDIVKNGLSNIGDNAKEAGQKTAENFNKAVENTLTPKKKVEFISLSSEQAQQVGNQIGENVAKGVSNGVRNQQAEIQKALKEATAGAEEAFSNALGGADDIDMGNISVDSTIGTLGKLEKKIAGLKELQNQAMSSDAWQHLQSQIEDTQGQIDAFKGKVQETGETVSQIDTISNSFSTLGNAIGGTAGNFFEFAATILSQIPQLITQISALTTAQVASSQSITAAKGSEAIASGTASSQSLPFPANLIALAATIASIVAALKTNFADGGIVQGSSFSGDKILAGLNSSEMVLNRGQQSRLFDMANGRVTPGKAQQPQPTVIVSKTRISKGDILISYEQAKKEQRKQTG